MEPVHYVAYGRLACGETMSATATVDRARVTCDECLDTVQRLPPEAPARVPAGRKLGSFLPGTFGAWLKTAKAGAVYWSADTMRNIHSAAAKAGVRVTVTRYFAVNSDCDAVKLVRVEVLAQD